MKAQTLKAAILPSLLAGTRRHALELHRIGLAADGSQPEQNSKSALTALALVGQALRFERRPGPEAFAVETWPIDQRNLVPESLRRAMLRLLAGRCSEDSSSALAWALGRARLRPHPFDLPRLQAFARAHAEHLGVTAQYWAQRETPAERQQGYFDADEIEEASWTLAPIGRRVRFLREMRAQEPEKARALLATAWAAESADARLRLLEAMEIGLSDGDREFLEGLKADRAPRVRGRAQRMLARLTGSEENHPALVDLLSRIQRTNGGLLRRRAVLKLELPATVKEPGAALWVKEAFADVGLEELARALVLDADDLPGASESDPNLLLGLAMMGTRERRLDLLEKIVSGKLPDAWGRMASCSWDELRNLPAEDRAQWAKTAVQPALWMPESGHFPWSWLHRQMEGPLPENVMHEVLHSQNWQTLLSKEQPPAAEHVQLLCALCPSPLRNTLRGQLEPLFADRKDLGLLLLDILDELENGER
jgi:hypothetical protein